MSCAEDVEWKRGKLLSLFSPSAEMQVGTSPQIVTASGDGATAKEGTLMRINVREPVHEISLKISSSMAWHSRPTDTLLDVSLASRRCCGVKKVSRETSGQQSVQADMPLSQNSEVYRFNQRQGR